MVESVERRLNTSCFVLNAAIKAAEHYENLLGMIVFVCNDCYRDAASD